MIYVYFANGTEELEFVSVVDALKRAEIDVVSVSCHIMTRHIIGAHKIGFVTDMSIAEIDDNECDMLVLPGGMPGTTNMLESEMLGDQIEHFIELGKPMAAICAAPMVLAHYGALKGRKATIYPGMENYLEEGGAIPVNERVVKDGNIITGQGPGTALEFALEIIEFVKGKEAAEKVKKEMLIR